MKEKIFIILYFLSLKCSLLCAQYPAKDSITKEIILQRLGNESGEEKKITVLLNYKDEILQRRLPKDTMYAWLLQQIAYRYSHHSKFSDAVNYSLQALAINRSYPNEKAIVILTRGQYYWLSTWYDSLNNTGEKRKAIDSCIAVSLRLRDMATAESISCIVDRTLYFYNIGEYKLCINDAEICQKSAMEYLKRTTIPGYVYFAKVAAANSFHWEINARLQLNDLPTAKTLLADKIKKYQEENIGNFLGVTYSQMAEVSLKENDPPQALNYYTLALKSFRQNGYYFSCKQTLNNIAEKIYVNYFKDYDKALQYFKKSLTYKNNASSFDGEDAVESMNIYGRIANIYTERKMFDTAFAYFKLALSQLHRDATIDQVLYSPPEEFNGYKKIDYLFNLLINYGDTYLKKFESEKKRDVLYEAINTYEKADKLLARINISQFEQESRLLWRNEARLLYENAIEACLLANEAGRAFYFFERSRATLLNIQLTEQNWIARPDINSLEDLKRRINRLNGVINNNNDSASNLLTRYRDSLRAMNDELYSLQQLIKTRYPLYYHNMDTVLVSVDRVRNSLLKDRQAVLEMFSGNNAVYSLLIMTEGIYLKKLRKDDFEKTVNAYTTYLSNYSLLNKSFKDFRETAHHLYRLIMQNNPVPPGRIIISPDGYYFPFESLISDNSSALPRYFILDYAVSYTYSIRYLLNNFGTVSTKAVGNFFGVAPVDYSGDHLSQLSGSDISLKTIKGALHNGKMLVGKEASRENFLTHFREYTIDQMYTHSSDSSHRNEPVIYFNDSALYLSELIPGGKPVTELIVLSACETGNGKLYKGEGVFSFNRGFASIGIPSSVTNLWSIDNKATYEITETFYKHLANGNPLDIALQQAKLDYMKGELSENQMPYFWAAPILVGKSDKIMITKPFPWIYLAAGIMIVAILFIVVKKTKRQKAALLSIPGITEIPS
jgi:CHAT domain-containing protein